MKDLTLNDIKVFKRIFMGEAAIGIAAVGPLVTFHLLLQDGNSHSLVFDCGEATDLITGLTGAWAYAAQRSSEKPRLPEMNMRYILQHVLSDAPITEHKKENMI